MAQIKQSRGWADAAGFASNLRLSIVLFQRLRQGGTHLRTG
jgi:hypothetical protein